MNAVVTLHAAVTEFLAKVISYCILWVTGNQNSNTGREFVLGFLPNHRPSISSWKFVFFLTSSKALNFTISCPGQNFFSSGYLQANTLASVEVPIGLVMSLGKGNNGIRITGTEELIVYGLNQAPHTTDAFLALPTYIQRFEYVVASYEGSGKSTVGVVAIDNATTVTILPSLQVNDGVTTYNAGQNSTFVLDSLQTILLQGDDVTGTRVFSDKIVSVLGGHECANVPIAIISSSRCRPSQPWVAAMLHLLWRRERLATFTGSWPLTTIRTLL